MLAPSVDKNDDLMNLSDDEDWGKGLDAMWHDEEEPESPACVSKLYVASAPMQQIKRMPTFEGQDELCFPHGDFQNPFASPELDTRALSCPSFQREAPESAPAQAEYDYDDFLYAAEGPGATLRFPPLAATREAELDSSAAEALAFWASASGSPFEPATAAAPAARAVARALARAALKVEGGVGEACAWAARALVDQVAGLAPDEAAPICALCDGHPLPSAQALAGFVRVVSCEVSKLQVLHERRRRAWRPLATWRAVQARAQPPTFEESAACALKLWSGLHGGRAFHDATHASLEARTLACELAFALSRLFRPADARGDVRRVAALGEAAHALVQRSALWAAEDVRCALGTVCATTSHPKASVTLFTNCVVALEQSTRRKKRPSNLKPAKFARFCDPSVPADLEPLSVVDEGSAASRLAERCVTAVRQADAAAPVVLRGCDVRAYDPATFREATLAARLGRWVAAALSPAPVGSHYEWGPDTEAQLLWRFDPTFAAALPADVRAAVSDPRGLVSALFTHNDDFGCCEPSPRHTQEVRKLVERAERLGTTQHAWLAPYYLHLSPTITMACRDFYARDPAARATAFATAIAFQARVD